jgi:hypothetical protein
VATASVAARKGHPNEDFAGAVPRAVVLVDGAGISGIEEICRHGVAPASVIRRVRQAEKHHAVVADDAAIAHCIDLAEP